MSDYLPERPIIVSIGNFKYTGGFRFASTIIKAYTGEFPKEFILKRGDILLAMTCQTPGGEILGIPGCIPNDGRMYLHNQRMGKVIIEHKDKVDAGFLYWLFLTREFNRHLVATATGTKVLHTAPDRIESFQFLLPPLPIQRTIADILATWDRAINLTEQLIVAKQQYKHGLMQQLLTGKRRFREFNNIPWFSLKAGDIFQTHSKRNNGDEELLSVTQERGVIPRSLLDTRVMMPSGETANYKLVKRGNFIISLRSFQGGIEYSEYRGLVSPAYTVLTSKQPIVDSFYKHLFKSQDFISRLGVAIIGIRDGKQINFEDFATIRLAYPTIEEQKRISDVLETYDHELALLNRKLALLEKQKQGLIQQLLTGKVRVKI